MHRAKSDPSPTRAPPSIRPAALADIPSLIEIEERSFLTDRMSARSFRHLLTHARADCIVAAIGGRIVGYAAIFYRRHARVARLHSLAVDPTVHRGGIGRVLLAAAEAAARRRDASLLRLAVRRDNHGAAHLYRSSSYREVGIEPAYYADGMAASTMEKNLAPG